MPRDIKELTLAQLEETIIALGYQRFYARQIFNWIYKKGALKFSVMSDLPKQLRDILAKDFLITSSELVEKRESLDGTQKLLLQLKDGNTVENVIIPAKNRVTGCISSQVGCKFSCRFCASGISGFKRNLTSAEIIGEALYLKNNSGGNPLTHLVFMGTGEPLDNYDSVFSAIRVINSSDAMNIGARRITISTCGIIPGIERLAHEHLQVELSVSLHAAFDKARSALMPVNKTYPLEDLLKCCRKYIKNTNRQVTFEYILIKGVNSTAADAFELSRILRGMNCKVNLIPANRVEELGIQPPAKQEIFDFKNSLLKVGVMTMLRTPRGQDIEAACGQLRLKNQKNK